MWVSWILLIVGIVLLAVLLVRLAGSRGAPPASGTGTGSGTSGTVPGEGSARPILDERYARGDISTAEYRERLEALRHDRP
ncbi:MAG: SHOCT domain-containing protein [Arthrobacter sp.]|uniref:SHOCT domain-containing protein n=1 Tax=Arthrobacter sp. TaxID=1667 RepID=UPI00346F6AC1